MISLNKPNDLRNVLYNNLAYKIKIDLDRISDTLPYGYFYRFYGSVHDKLLSKLQEKILVQLDDKLRRDINDKIIRA